MAPNRNIAPGRIFKVAIYTLEYSGPYTRGIVASASPKREFTFPENYIQQHRSTR